MPNSEINSAKIKIEEKKNNNNYTNINEKEDMLEISTLITKQKSKKEINFKYNKFHLILSAIIIIIFYIAIKNISHIVIYSKERSLKNNLMRSFSQINTPPSSAGGAPLYWKNEKKLHIQKVKREINYYIKDPVLEFNNKADFIKRENPKISLVIPIYNTEKFLIPLYKSIQNQSLKDIEIIFIDDNSSDNSVKVIEEFMQEDKRIILIKHDTNYKTFYSRNEGVGVAKAKYILFIDPDDLILNDILEKCYETAEKNNLDILQFYSLKGNYKKMKLSTGDKYKSGILYQPQIKDIFYYGHTRNIWDKLFKRELFSGVRFPEGHVYEDAFPCVKLFDKAERVVLVDESLYNYRRRTGSITASVNMDMIGDCLLAHYSVSEFIRHKWSDIIPEPLYLKKHQGIVAFLILKYIKLIKSGSEDKTLKRELRAQIIKTKREVGIKTLEPKVKIFYTVIKVCPALMRVLRNR